MGALAGKKASIRVCDGMSTALTNEPTTADVNREVYQITDSGKRWLDPSVPVTVKVNGTTANPGSYSVAYAGGKVRFHEPQAAGATVTVTGQYFTSSSEIGQGKSWEISLDVDTEDVSVFGDTFKKFQALQNGGTVSLDRFAIDTFFLDLLGNPMILLLYVSENAVPRFECVGRLTSDSIKAATNGLIEESVEFQIDGEPNFVEG